MCANQRCLQTLPNVPGACEMGSESPPIEKRCSKAALAILVWRDLSGVSAECLSVGWSELECFPSPLSSGNYSPYSYVVILCPAFLNLTLCGCEHIQQRHESSPLQISEALFLCDFLSGSLSFKSRPPPLPWTPVAISLPQQDTLLCLTSHSVYRGLGSACWKPEQ